MQKQEKKHDSALQDNKQEQPGQAVMHLRATSVPPGYHDRGGKPVLTEEGLVALLSLGLLCTGDGEIEDSRGRVALWKSVKGIIHSLSEKYISIK